MTHVSGKTATALSGHGDIRFTVRLDLLQRPEYWQLGACSDVGIDADDRLWVASRRQHPISVWSSEEGSFIGSWPAGDFVEVHHIQPMGSSLWVVDDQLHVVRRYTLDGELTLEMGHRGTAVAAVTHRGQNGGPFNMPTGIAAGRNGELFVSDGYGNRQVHRFAADGSLEKSWGRGGIGPGEFGPVHSVTVDGTDRVIICDRENNRVQLFDYDGGFVAEWGSLYGPADAAVGQDGLVYVVEQGDAIAGRMNHQPNGISILTMKGEVVGHWYDASAGPMVGGHGLAVDSKGNVYVADLAGKRVVKFVRESAGGGAS
jgi:DNA-binding beta-propeller fold protein YncE